VTVHIKVATVLGKSNSRTLSTLSKPIPVMFYHVMLEFSMFLAS